MTRNVNERAREYGRWHRFHTRWGRLLSVMACVVVFCTTYALILPAITLDQQTYCGQEEHTHNLEECYSQELICTDESPEHVHSDACYLSALTCQIPEHQHSEACYEAPEETTAAETASAETAPAETVPAETETAEETTSSAQVLALTEQTVTATVYEDATYATAYTQPVTITLQGNLPEGVAVKAYPVTVTVNGKEAVEAYDIALFITDMNGEAVEYEPDSAVQVTITSDNLQDLNSVNVYHIDDADEANPDPQPELVTEGAAVSEENQIAFSAEKFSIYAVEGAESSDGTSLASISGSTSVVAGSSITLSCSSRNCSNGTWTVSDTNIATITTNNWSTKSAALTGVSAGTVTVTHTHSSWSGSTDTSTLTVTVTNEQAQIYALVSPEGIPGSNDSSQWTADHGWTATINVNGATWDSNNKNIVDNAASYIVSWPDGSTGSSWTLKSGEDYFDTLLKDIFSAYRKVLANKLGIDENIIKESDIKSITLTPYKISQNNGTTPDKHIDCTLSVQDTLSYTARFNVKEVGKTGYEDVYNKLYLKTAAVNEYTYTVNGKSYKIGDTKTVDGVTYVFTGWYTENENGEARSNTKATFGYKPSDAELSDGAVNFYAEWVPATKDITIVKYASGDKNTLLEGADFTLSGIDGTYTTDQYGQVTINDVPYGTYTLTETTAPNNYVAMTGTVSVTVGDTISINAGITGATYENGVVYVPNELSKINFTLKKVDSADSTKTLSGATFTLTGGKVNQEVTTGADGTATFEGIPAGTYTLTETKAPDGYNILTDSITITVQNGKVTASNGDSVTQDDNGAYVVTVKNSAGTTLPVTGGPGTTLYTLSGLMLVAFATAGGLMYSGKLRKKGVTR